MLLLPFILLACTGGSATEDPHPPFHSPESAEGLHWPLTSYFAVTVTPAVTSQSLSPAEHGRPPRTLEREGQMQSEGADTDHKTKADLKQQRGNLRLEHGAFPQKVATGQNMLTHLSHGIATSDATLIEIVNFVLTHTTGRQMHFIYDDVFTDIAQAVKRCNNHWADVIVMKYGAALTYLESMIRSLAYTEKMRNFILLCTTNQIKNIFEMVRNRALESSTVQWVLVVDQGDWTRNGFEAELQEMLREGSQVAAIERLSSGGAKLFTSRVKSDGVIRFEDAGLWWMDDAGSGSYLKMNPFPDIEKVYSDFQGRELIVAANDNWPFFKIGTLDNGTIYPETGVDVTVMGALSKKLNFTYRVVNPPDGKWGGPQPDGTITGIIGMVARHEAHLTICELTVTGIRETVVDFTTPYYMESTTLVSRAPKEKSRTFAIFSPFRAEVWLAIFASTTMTPLVVFLLRSLSLSGRQKEAPQPRLALENIYFNMYRSLMVQSNLIAIRRWPLRFTFFCWYLFCFCIFAMYSGTLTAVLAVPSFEKPIDSLHDLAEAHANGFTIGTTRESSFEGVFKSATSGIYREVWLLFDHKEPSNSFLPSPASGIEKVLKTKYVHINAQLNSKLKATELGLSQFYIARETFMPQGYGIACSSGSPLKDVFSRVLTSMTEAGLVYKWAQDEVNKIAGKTQAAPDKGPTAINLQHLQAAFFLVLLGYGLALTALVAEIISARLCGFSFGKGFERSK